jgi:hypothetical protein
MSSRRSSNRKRQHQEAPASLDSSSSSGKSAKENEKGKRVGGKQQEGGAEVAEPQENQIPLDQQPDEDASLRLAFSLNEPRMSIF